MTTNNQNNNSLPNIDWERVKVDSKYRKEVARRSHKHFFAIYLSHYGEHESAPMHNELFSMTENDDLFSVVQAFRGSGKSTICTLSYPMYAVLGKQERKFIVICSATEELSQRHLANVKAEFEINARLRHDFGMVHEEESPWNSKALSFSKHGAMIAAISIDQSMRGIRFGSKRPDVFIFDDIEDRKTMRTQEGRDKVFETINSDFVPAGAKDKKLIFVGSSLHADSPMNRLRDAIAEKEINGSFYHFPIVDMNGAPTWKGMYPDANAIAKKRKEVLGEVAWYNEYLLEATTPADQIVKLDDFHYYDKGDLEQLDTGLIVLAVDPAIKQGSRNDYTGIVPILIVGDKAKRQYYVLDDIVKKRMNSTQTQAKLISMINQYGKEYVHVIIEDVGYQSALIEQLEGELGRGRVHGYKPGRNNKIDRVYEVSAHIETGKILFPKNSKRTKELIHQITDIETTKYDDLADALTLGVLAMITQNIHSSSFGFIFISDDPNKPSLLITSRYIRELKKNGVKGDGLYTTMDIVRESRRYKEHFFKTHGRYPHTFR